MPIDVLIADDHELIRVGLAELLDGAEIHIVGNATTAEEAYQKTIELRPGVLLLDLRFSDHDSFDVLDRIGKQVPETRVVIFSSYDNPTYIARAVALGARDYLLKGSSRKEIVDAMGRAATNQPPATGSLVDRMISVLASTTAANQDIPLTKRETQVLKHIALGLSNKEIARSLNISVETVKEHVQNILRKTDVSDRTQAAVWAVRREMV